MPLITWRSSRWHRVQRGSRHAGTNLMEAAVAAGIRGIHGDCGGALACATCHVATEP